MAIHWWRTDRLVDELAQDRISEQQSLWYAAISMIMYFEAIYYAMWFAPPRSWILMAEFVAACVIAVIGLQECLKANGGAKGSDFLKRLYCLGVPIGLKIALFGFIAGQIIYFVFPILVTTESFRNPHFVYQLYSFVFVGMLNFAYFWRIAHHMARITKAGS